MSSPGLALELADDERNEYLLEVKIGKSESQGFAVIKQFPIQTMFGLVMAEVGDIVVLTPKGVMVIADRIKRA